MKTFHRIWEFNNWHVWAVLLQGFSSGLPIALVAGTLQAWLTVSNINLISIGVFSLVGLPYLYKFLWAPLLDRYIPPFLGRRRGWIFIFQMSLVLSIAGMALVRPAVDLKLMACLAVLTAFLSSSQDIGINAYMTDILTKDERGFGAAMSVLGYRLALLVSGALALIMASFMGWRDTYLVMSLVMLANGIITWFVPEPKQITPPLSLSAALIDPLKEFFKRDSVFYILLFVVLYKLGEAFALSLSTTFLLRGLHFGLVTVGTVNKFGAMLATLIGAVLGGLLMPRLKLFRALLLFGILETLAILFYIWLASAGKNYLLMVVAIVLENFTGGMATTAFTAFLMFLCDHRYTATQFALFTAVAAFGRVLIGPVAGVVANDFGWVQFFVWAFLASVPGLLLLLFLNKKIDLNRDTI